MRIGIDVRYLSHGLMGGVHTYIKQFVPTLIDIADGHEIFLYADGKRPFELTDLAENVTLRLLPWRNGLSSVYLDLFMRRRMAEDQLDVVHYPANYGFGPAQAKTVVTLHDALNIHPLPNILRGLADSNAQDIRHITMMTYLHYMTERAIQDADLLLTVSEYARQEILRYSGLSPAKVVAVHHAPTSDLVRVEDPDRLADVRKRYRLPKRFVLADALKNPTVIVKAWQLLSPDVKTNAKLVFFCRRPDPLPIVLEAVDAGDALFLHRPPREDLVALYSMADAFVFPSWTEGFGLPVLEAMTCGAPVIASDRGSIPEVAGDAALLIDAEDATALVQSLTAVLTDAELRERLHHRGLQRAHCFTWQATTRSILDAYINGTN